MATILVIEDEAMVREPLAVSLTAHGHQVCCAGDGPTALSNLESSIPDMILLDIRMPGMDGIALLHEIRANARTAAIPVLLLSSSTDRDLIMQAAKCGIQGYLLKSAFSMSELLDRIGRIGKQDSPTVLSNPAATSTNPPDEAISCGTLRTPSAGGKSIPAKRPEPPIVPNMSLWPKLLTREETLERLEQVASGKTVAGVVAQLLAVVNSPRADLGDVVQVIQSDPVLATRVLQLANAASTGSRGRARTVKEAARNLGVRGIQNMAISIGIFGAFPPDERDGFNTMRCWQHSFAVAELLNLLERERDPEQESMNHLIGLCHDLGEILLRQHFAAEYAQVLTFALSHRLPVYQVESVALGIRHAELVSRLLARIGLPVPAVQGIREFYERQIRHQAAGLSAQTQALGWANLAAHGMLLAASAHEVVRPITRVEWNQLNSSKPPPVLDAATMRNDILTTTNILARLPESEQRRLLQPLIPPHDKKIWYIRPESFVAFDPLAFALTLCSQVTIAPGMPPDDAWGEIDALVLVALRPGGQGINPADLAQKAAAANHPELPILCLVAQECPPAVEGTVQLRSYPISLQELGEWLANVRPRQPIPAVSAT